MGIASPSDVPPAVPEIGPSTSDRQLETGLLWDGNGLRMAV